MSLYLTYPLMQIVDMAYLSLTLSPLRLYHTIILNDCVVCKSMKFYTNLCKI